ncbi:MAG: hypothetical protein GKR94_26525 [Gammaproteobacteria bacterium]|nr:hypothetical protein [Gammaproteobacteria bacterium]
MYVDIHTHLTHERFAHDVDAVVARARTAGLGAIMVNGLEPVSNRAILELAKTHDIVEPALGLYPVDAVCHLLPDDFTLRVNRFDVDAEIAFIRSMAGAGRLSAVGECGLDGHWLGPETFPEQERVFEELIGIAMEYRLPLIIHTRKRERRCAEILRHSGAQKVDFHCYGGKAKQALRWAHEDGWWFSIPANARRNEAFAKLLRELPQARVLTETDAPYMSAKPGERSEPAAVVDTVALLAELRGWTVEQAREQVWTNYQSLRGPPGQDQL